jgi:hypothetical protein
MTALHVDLACGDYDIVRPLRGGSVKAEGMEINFVTLNKPPEVHWRMGVNKEFDAAEMSLSSFVAGKARDDFPFVGMPAFVYRKFGTHAPTSMSELEREAGGLERKARRSARMADDRHGLVARIFARRLWRSTARRFLANGRPGNFGPQRKGALAVAAGH